MRQIEVFDSDDELECSMCDRKVDALVRTPILGSPDEAWIGWCEDCCRKIVEGWDALRAKSVSARVWSWIGARFRTTKRLSGEDQVAP